MSENKVAIIGAGDSPDKLTLEFDREGFQDFVSSLFASSREERKSIEIGFDLLPRDIKILMEKLNHQITTQNDCLNSDFIANVKFEDNSELTVGSIEALTMIDEGGRPRVAEISCTATYMVGFLRLNAAKEYERQVVSIVFAAGSPGSIEVGVRSTELTWPHSIRNTIAKEVTAISRRSLKGSGNIENKFLFLASIFQKTTNRNGNNDPIRPWRQRILLSSLFALLIVYGVMINEIVETRDVYIYNSEAGYLEVGSFEKVIEEHGWERASELAILSEKLKQSGVADYAPGSSPLSRSTARFSEYFSVMSLLVAIAVGLFVILCAREGVGRNLRNEGRIFLREDEVTERAKVELFAGFWPSALSAILFGVITTALMNVF